MSLNALSLILGAVGVSLASINIVGGWLEKRRRGTVDERRLDVEGLKTLVDELRQDNKDLRDAREDDRNIIDAQGRKIVELTNEVDDLRRERRKDHDQIDRLMVALEAVKK